jgi:hypothetical protein
MSCSSSPVLFQQFQSLPALPVRKTWHQAAAHFRSELVDTAGGDERVLFSGEEDTAFICVTEQVSYLGFNNIPADEFFYRNRQFFGYRFDIFSGDLRVIVDAADAAAEAFYFASLFMSGFVFIRCTIDIRHFQMSVFRK